MLRILHIAVGDVRSDTLSVLTQVFRPYTDTPPASLSAPSEAIVRKILCTDAKSSDLVVLTGDAACCRKAVNSLTDAGALRPLTLSPRISGWICTRTGHIWIWLPDDPDKQTALLYERVLPLLPAKPELSHTVGIFGLSPAVLTERLAPFLSGDCPRCCLYRLGSEWRLRLTAPCAEEERMNRALSDICKALGSSLYGIDCPDLRGRVQELLQAKSLTAAVTGLQPLSKSDGDRLIFIQKEQPGVKLSAPPDDTAADAEADVPEYIPLSALQAQQEHRTSLGLTFQPDPSASKPTVRLSLTDGKRLWNKTLTGDDAFALEEEAEGALWDLTRRYLEAFPLVMAGGEPVTLPEKQVDIPVSPLEKEQPLLLRPVRRSSEQAFRIILTCVLAAVTCLSVGLFWYFHFYKRTPISTFRDLEALYQTEVSAQHSDEYPKDMLPQFYSLYKENTDIAGWIRLDKNQSYPIMNGLSRIDYSCRGFLGQSSSYGVPYFFPAVPRADKNACLIVYGNHMEDGTMFSCLMKYLDADYVRSHATIEMNTIYRTGIWQVFAAFTLDENDTDLNFTRTAFTDDADRLLFVRELMRRSKLNISTDVENGQELLLLTTTATADSEDTQRVLVAFYRVDNQPTSTVNVSQNTTARPNTSSSPSSKATGSVPSSDTASDSSAEQSRPAESSEEVSEDGGTEFIEPSEEVSQPATTTATTKAAAHTTTIAVSTRTSVETTPSSKPTETSAASASSQPSSAQTASSAAATSAHPANGSVPIREGTISESEYYSLFRLKDTRTGKTFVPSTREELTLGLFYLVKREMGAAVLMKNSVEAQKAQAVASYTFVLYYCKNNGTPYSFAFPSYDPDNTNDRKIYTAVETVTGIKIIYPEKPLASQAINAMYCSSSAGVTSTCQKVYTASLPYLVSVKSPYDTDEHLKKYSGGALTAQFTITYTELLDALGKKLDLARSEIYADKGEVPLYATAWDGGENGYVYLTNLYYYQNGKKTYIKGKLIRDAVNAYTSASMRSHAFTVTAYDSQTDVMTVQTRGYGHGLGLSQYGAVGYANEAGWTYDRILAHYYSITENTPYQLVAPKY